MYNFSPNSVSGLVIIELFVLLAYTFTISSTSAMDGSDNSTTKGVGTKACYGSGENYYCTSDDDFPIGAIVGITLAAILIVIVIPIACCFCCACCCFSGRSSSKVQSNIYVSQPPVNYQPPAPSGVNVTNYTNTNMPFTPNYTYPNAAPAPTYNNYRYPETSQQQPTNQMFQTPRFGGQPQSYDPIYSSPQRQSQYPHNHANQFNQPGWKQHG